jgi:hypothetical protein
MLLPKLIVFCQVGLSLAPFGGVNQVLSNVSKRKKTARNDHGSGSWLQLSFQPCELSLGSNHEIFEPTKMQGKKSRLFMFKGERLSRFLTNF